jgi:aspartyl-tRNA(Asn)/glutamyl-tRNA(Gln) amidotransferase subunit B
VCLGLPGALPVMNTRADRIRRAAGPRHGLPIANRSIFARKNYFYPDCPKDYQISQFDTPLCSDGHSTSRAGRKRIRIKRIHVEEDAGKLLHVDNADHSHVDFNRSGVPLVEIVSEPDLRSAREASEYLQKLRSLVRYLEICDGNMEEGSLRCDVNLSIRPEGSETLGTKTEVKNLNSFKQVEQAIEFEFERQSKVLSEGGRIAQDTLLWDAAGGRAIVMRSKEEAHDYRYFPEPDLRVLLVSEATISRVRDAMPELPDAKEKRFVSQYKLPAYDAALLTGSRDIAQYYEDVVGAGADSKAASNWVMGEVMREMNERGIDIAVSRSAGRRSRAGRAAGERKDQFDHGQGRLQADARERRRRAPTSLPRAGSSRSATRPPSKRIARAVLDENPDEVARYLAGKSNCCSSSSAAHEADEGQGQSQNGHRRHQGIAGNSSRGMNSMSAPQSDKKFTGYIPDIYERFFVPFSLPPMRRILRGVFPPS